jgi:uncharacterized OsmC-like protein
MPSFRCRRLLEQRGDHQISEGRSEMPTNEMQTNKINGVDVNALFDTIKAVEKNSCIAAFKFRNRNKWVDGGENCSMINEYYGAMQEHARPESFVMTNDEPPVLLGRDRGPNPVEYVLHALAGCLTTSLVYHAAARGIRVEEVETRFEGDLDLRGFLGISDEVRNGYQEIRVVFDVKADASEETIAELVGMAQKFSPVFDIVSHGTPVKVTLGQAVASMKAA